MNFLRLTRVQNAFLQLLKVGRRTGRIEYVPMFHICVKVVLEIHLDAVQAAFLLRARSLDTRADAYCVFSALVHARQQRDAALDVLCDRIRHVELQVPTYQIVAVVLPVLQYVLLPFEFKKSHVRVLVDQNKIDEIAVRMFHCGDLNLAV